MPFYRMRVRLKKEIVTLGVPGLNPARNAGTYVKPEDWNALIDDPGVVVIDTRNDYEVGIGTFDRAINPHTRSFSEFPAWVAEQSARWVLAGNPKVAMFCTGGIRCEKSTAFSNHKALRRCTTWKAAFSSTWKQCLRSPAAGMVTALCLTSGCP